MYRVRAGIKGIAPILFNRFGVDEIKGRVTEEARRKAALQKVYRNEQGLYLPGLNIKKAIVLAASMVNLKMGRKGLAQFIEAGVFVEEREIPLGKKEPDFVDERVGRIPPKTGAHVMIYRPGLKEGWRAAFTLQVAYEPVPEDLLKLALENAGLLKGVCDGRPEFGRFIVEEWKLVKAR